MKGDFTRFTFDPHKRYSRVLMQQGRVQLDADWNEMVEMQTYFLRTLAADVIGPHGGPAESFKINDMETATKQFQNNFAITPGRYYVDGILCVNEPSLSEPFLYASQSGFLEGVFGKLEKNNQYVIYLDVWERHVTYVEDEHENGIGIREVALRRPDTTTRTQIVWQVKCLPSTVTPAPDYKSDDGYKKFLELLEPSRDDGTKLTPGKLRARAIKPTSADNGPCLTSPEARYRGAENQLYRVEIHDGGELGKATFKWSRENGAVIFPIEHLEGKSVILAHLGPDDRFGLRPDDWVEIVDDDYVLQNRAEPLLQIKDIDPDLLQVTLKQSPVPNIGSDSKKHPLLRRWDSASVRKVEIPTKNDGWLALEDGVEIHFDGDEKSFFRTGDYWLIPARVATGDVEWPKERDNQGKLTPAARSPHGVEHHYAPLALISLTATDGTVNVDKDYRRALKSIGQ